MNKWVRRILIIICLCVAVYEGVYIVRNLATDQAAIDEYSAISQETVQEGKAEEILIAPAEEYADDIGEKPSLQIDHASLLETNEQYIGWLDFPAVDISYPIVMEETENQFLRTTFEGKTNTAGSIFMDVYSDPNFQGYSDFLFGHNMRNRTMFGNMRELYQSSEGDPLEEHPYFFVYTEDAIYKYLVFAYEMTTNGSEVYDEITTDEAYDAYLEGVFARSMYDCEEEVDFTDRPELLNLSTCSGRSGGSKRFVVHGVKVYTYPQKVS